MTKIKLYLIIVLLVIAPISVASNLEARELIPQWVEWVVIIISAWITGSAVDSYTEKVVEDDRAARR